MNIENLMKYTKKLEKLLIQKEMQIEALNRGASLEGLVCSIFDTITFLLDDLRHNIFNIFLIYNSSLRNPGDSSHTVTTRDERAYDLIKRINYQQHILIGLNEKLFRRKWCLPRTGEYSDINSGISKCVHQIRNHHQFNSRARIKLNLNRHIPAAEFCDCDLFQIIYHFTTNFIEAGSKHNPPEIEITTDMHNGNISIRISENCRSGGIAGSETDLTIISKDSETERKAEFGISACREIVNSYGGRLKIEKGYPGGTVATIILTINQPVKGSSGS